MYTIRSVSEDGTYYLVNHWNTYKTWWTRDADIIRNGFKTPGLAARSLNKLIKFEPEYLNDHFTLMRFDEQNRTLIEISNTI